MAIARERDRLGEVGVAPTPVVNNLRPLHADSVRDLDSVNQVVELYQATHPHDATTGALQLRVAPLGID